jgi:hypothetical protein
MHHRRDCNAQFLLTQQSVRACRHELAASRSVSIFPGKAGPQRPHRSPARPRETPAKRYVRMRLQDGRYFQTNLAELQSIQALPQIDPMSKW